MFRDLLSDLSHVPSLAPIQGGTACGAGLAVAIGCLTYGAVGLAVMVAGLAAGSLPALALRRA